MKDSCHRCSPPAGRGYGITAAAGVLLAAGVLGGAGVPAVVWYAASILAGGSRVFPRGLAALRRLRLDINTLVTLAAVGAAAIGQWQEGALVLFLFALGETLETASLERTRRSLQALVELAPRQASAWREGEFRPVAVETIGPGDRVLVRPGERVPVDGVVVEGSSWLDTSAITGEFFPAQAGPGAGVHAGTLNGNGSLTVLATAAAQDTTLARIIDLVERARAEKAPVQRLVDRFAAWYTPLVLALAALAALGPPILLGEPFAPWLYRALAFLLLACPCALVIATPVAVVSAIGHAARRGVLIKGGRHLEALSGIRAVVFDKTGTVTEGRPELVAVAGAPGWDRRAVLELAAAVEAGSEHPLGAAVRRAAADAAIAPAPAGEFTALPGTGVRARVEAGQAWVARPEFAPAGALEPRLRWAEDRGLTAVLVGMEDRAVGMLAFRDAVRARAGEAVEALRAQGIAWVEMLSGDAPAAVTSVAAGLGVDAWQGGLLPAAKERRVRELAGRHGAVAMVGDGINDAPALAAATVGIALGRVDAALDNAGVALVRPDLGRVAYAIGLGRRTRRVIAQNVALAVGIKLGLLALAVPGWLTLWLAVLGDSGVALLVILNSLRLLQEPGSPAGKSPAIPVEPSCPPGAEE